MTVVQVVSVLLEMLLELISGYVYVTRTTEMVHDGTAVLVHDVSWVVGGVVGSADDGLTVVCPLETVVMSVVWLKVDVVWLEVDVVWLEVEVVWLEVDVVWPTIKSALHINTRGWQRTLSAGYTVAA